jgi:hypothetical protein
MRLNSEYIKLSEVFPRFFNAKREYIFIPEDLTCGGRDGYREYIPTFLKKYAMDNDLPIILLGD